MAEAEHPASLNAILAALDWIYDRAIQGVPGFESAVASAQSAGRDGARTGERAVDAVIRRHIMEASAAGFLANVGGVLTLPISLPANLGSVLFIQLRMIAAIAYLSGYDVHSHQVKALAMACLGGSAALDVLKGAGITAGTRLTQRAISHLSTVALARANREHRGAAAEPCGRARDRESREDGAVRRRRGGRHDRRAGDHGDRGRGEEGVPPGGESAV